MAIYLDHAATTPLDPDVMDAMRPYFDVYFGNASSQHAAGREAEMAVDRARESIARALGADPKEIYFTSGGRSLSGQAAVAARFSAMTGYRAAAPEGAAAYGGLTDWAVGRMGIPSFTIECGEGKNPLPESAFAPAWREIRPLLFRAPLYAAPTEKQKGDAAREYRTL